jgi:hypothetical protein
LSQHHSHSTTRKCPLSFGYMLITKIDGVERKDILRITAATVIH